MLPFSRRNIHRFCRISVLIWYIHIFSVYLWAEENHINDKVINKWKAYENFSRSLQGTARKTIIGNSVKNVQSLTVYKQNQNCVSRCTRDEKLSKETCQIANPRYAAFVKGSRSNPKDFVLDRFSEDPHAAFPGFSESIFDMLFSEISPHFYAGSTPLSRIVFDPNFKIIKTAKLPKKDGEFVRLDFRVKRENKNTGFYSDSSGWLVLDPTRCWCVLRSKVFTKVTIKGVHTMDSENETEFETVDHPSGFPLLKSKTSRNMRHTYKDKENKTTSQVKIDYEWVVNDRVPDSEFTLTAFGLPEPGSDEVKKSTPLYVWILIAAAVSVGLAIGFFILARRSRAKSAA